LTGAEEEEVDVVVVGCGTTGLVLARLLALEDLRVALVDTMRLPRSFPRATHLDDETMRTFQTLGLAHLEQDFSLMGLHRLYDAEWRPVLEVDFASTLTDQNWQSDYQFHQPDFEAILRGMAHSHPRSSHYFGWEATGLTAASDTATLRICERSTGEERSLRAAYVVGCDGAHSFVQRQMRGTQLDFNAVHRSLIVDIYPFVESKRLKGRDMFIQAGIRNPLTFVATSEPRLRFEQMLRAEDDANEFERNDHVYELLSPWLAPEEYLILRSDVYEWHAVVAEVWREGSLLVAGDAAHETPPHLGQGMCIGIRDSMNLAWKLARVARGESPPELLDTYEAERGPHAITYVSVAAEMANQVEGMEPPVGVQEGDEVPTSRMDTLRLRIGPGIRLDDSDERAGFLSAQPRLADGQLLDDAAGGYRFVVFGKPYCIADVGPDAKAYLDSLNAKVVAADSDEARSWMQELGCAAVLIRPDHYIFGTADTAVELDALVASLQAALAERTSVGAAT